MFGIDLYPETANVEESAEMAQSVKLPDDVMADVRRESELQSRSLAGQISHWIKIARAIERSENFDYSRIEAALAAQLSPDRLSADEQDVWFAEFGRQMTEASETEKDYFAERRKLGRGVGLNDRGELVRHTEKS